MRLAKHSCWLAFVAVLSLARGARAEPGAVLVGGTVSARQKLVASNAVATEVRGAGWSIGSKTYNAADAVAAAGCLRMSRPWRCLPAILRDERVRRVAIVSIEPKPGKAGTTDTVITERLAISNLDSLFVAQRFCDHCTDDRLAGLATELTKELLERAAVDSGRTVLAIKSTPPGARAYVDANLVGVTDISINVAPGPHSITVELDEHRTATQHIQVQENTTQEVSFAVRSTETSSQAQPVAPDHVASDGPAGPARPPVISRRSRLVPGVIAGAGLAAFATGVVLFALDQDPVTRPDQDASRRYRDTRTRGIVLGATGLAAAGIGGYLWWRYGKARSAPVVIPVDAGAAVGLAHSF